MQFDYFVGDNDQVDEEEMDSSPDQQYEDEIVKPKVIVESTPLPSNRQLQIHDDNYTPACNLIGSAVSAFGDASLQARVTIGNNPPPRIFSDLS